MGPGSAGAMGEDVPPLRGGFRRLRVQEESSPPPRSGACEAGNSGLDLLTPAQASLHRNFLSSVAALHRDLIRAAYYLLQIRERRVHRLLGYARVADYAAAEAGLTPNQCREFLELARRLPHYPEIEAAMRKGELTWSQARAICARAAPADQQRWLSAASALSGAGLERALRFPEAPRSGATDQALPATADPGMVITSAAPAVLAVPAVPATDPVPPTEPSVPALPVASELQVTPTSPAASEPAASPAVPAAPILPTAPASTARHAVTLLFLPEQYALWQRLAEAARRRGDPVEAVLDGLAGRQAGGASGAPLVVILNCPTCGRADWPTSRGEIPVPRPALEAAFCDAVVEDSSGDRRRTLAPRLRRGALQRARYRCERPGCGQAVFLQVHHRRQVAGAGDNSLENLMVLCWRCHRALHQAEAAARAALREAPS